MEKWPGWSAPLLGGFGGGIAGLALTGDPRFPFPPVYSTLGGVAFGVLAGLVVWLRDQSGRATDPPPSVVTQLAASAPSSRWFGALLAAAGTGCLAINHTLVATIEEKWFTLVFGGSFFVTAGLAGLIMPSLLTAGAIGEKAPLWHHLVAGILALGGIVLGLYLWLAVY